MIAHLCLRTSITPRATPQTIVAALRRVQQEPLSVFFHSHSVVQTRTVAKLEAMQPYLAYSIAFSRAAHRGSVTDVSAL